LNIVWLLGTFLGLGLGIFFLSNAYGERQTPDIIFLTTNASAKSSDEHQFNVTISDMGFKKKLCKSANCSIEIVKVSDNSLPNSLVITPEPSTQNMNSGVDIRIHDAANDGMSETERAFKERWNIWANCGIKGIEKGAFVCGHDTFDTITLSNKILGTELMVPLIDGHYDQNTDTMKFTANVK